jgi:hypothetical protein
MELLVLEITMHTQLFGLFGRVFSYWVSHGISCANFLDGVLISLSYFILVLAYFSNLCAKS